MNSVMATFTLPFIVNLSFLYFMTDQQQIGMPIEKMAQVFLLIIVPVCVGMAVRNAMPQIALQLGKPMRLMSIYFIFALFFYALFRERANVFDYFSAIGIATALFCFLSLPAVLLFNLLFHFFRFRYDFWEIGVVFNYLIAGITCLIVIF